MDISVKVKTDQAMKYLRRVGMNFLSEIPNKIPNTPKKKKLSN
jgi:hypothetical protein